MEIKPCDDLKKYYLPAGTSANPTIDPADWLTLASIRDSENWAGPFCYDAVSGSASAIYLAK